MGMDNISDKVNINVGDGGGSGMGGMAAVIAALGNRNQGNDNAALIAALGNRNGSGDLAPLMAMMHRDNDGDGMNNMWPILLLLLLRGRGGLGGDDGCCGTDGHVSPAQAAILQTLLEGQSDLRAQVPTTALETQNAIQSSLASLALGTQQGFANTKDAVQALSLYLSGQLNNINQNVSDQGCKTRETVQDDGDKTRSLLVSRFQMEDATKIAEQNARIVALEARCDNDRRHSEATLQITNTNTAVAAQAQFQQQQQSQFQIDSALERAVGRIVGSFNQTMLARQGQDIVNLGTMTASGTQAAANTQVR